MAAISKSQISVEIDIINPRYITLSKTDSSVDHIDESALTLLAKVLSGESLSYSERLAYNNIKALHDRKTNETTKRIVTEESEIIVTLKNVDLQEVNVFLDEICDKCRFIGDRTYDNCSVQIITYKRDSIFDTYDQRKWREMCLSAKSNVESLGYNDVTVIN